MMSDQIKRYLAWGLGGVFVVSAAMTTGWLYAEGSRICDNLVDNLPSDQSTRPCELVYRRSRQGAAHRRVKLEWAGSDLHHVEFDGAEASNDGSGTSVSCSTAGRIALPLTHFRHWLTISVLQNIGAPDSAWRIIDRRMESRSTGAARRVMQSADGETDRVAADARRVRGFDADGDGIIDQIQSSTRRSSPEGHVSTHRYFEPSSGDKVRHIRIHRDDQGLVTTREILLARQGPPTHIDYRYSCERH
jgi:hypothetical protein